MWARFRGQLWQWRGVLIAAPGVAAIVVGLRVAGLLQPFELAALDQFFGLRPPEPIDPRVIVVEIREVDLQQQKQYPLPDGVLAQVLNRIKQQKPRAIGLDLYRDFPIEPGHADLVKVFEFTPNLIGIQKVISGGSGTAVNPPPLLQNLEQVSANDVVVDTDGRVRRSLLSVDLSGNQPLLTLGAALALLYLETDNIFLEEDSQTGQLRLGKAVFDSLQENDGAYVRADTGGYQILANFRNLRSGFTSISLTEVLTGQIPPDLFRDRIVLLGVTAESTGDFFLTPYSASWGGRLTSRASGVAIHADVASQLLSAALDGRSPLRFWSEPGEWLWIGAWATVGAIVSWGLRYREGLASRVHLTAISILFLGAGLVGGCYLAFLAGWWVPVVPGVLALGGSAIAITSHVARSATSIRETFSRYLTDEVVASLLETPQGLKLGGEKRKVTILMADLRGFSAISERITPEQTVEFVNRYLEIMTEVINQYGGTVHEFLGDGIFVLFGAPIAGEDDAQRAVACAIAMQLAMERVNQQTQAMNLPLVEMGIGIHTGEVLAGNIGSQKRAKYTVIGNHVNLASRIESYTVGGQVLVSRSVLDEVGATLRIDHQLQATLKGIQEPLTLYEIGGIAGEFNLYLPGDGEEMVVLTWQIPVEYTVLEGKRTIATPLQANITRLSANQAEIVSPHSLDLLSNLKLHLLTNTPKSRGLRDVYAKVIEQTEAGFCVRFTAVPPEVAALFDYLQQRSGKD